MRFVVLTGWVFFWLIQTAPLYAQSMKGFNLSNAAIPVEEIMDGGPPRDGIPSIDRPKFISTNEVDFLNDNDIVIGFSHNGENRAYPLRILIWHEIVNDKIVDRRIAVTYCPLCGTAMVFDRVVNGKTRTFGVSGLLYQSDVLMYDRQTESLWSQLAMKSVSGPSINQRLELLHSEHMTWKAWKTKYPNGKVLSTQTGFKRNYNSSAYASYFASDQLMFPVKITRHELNHKSMIVGIVLGNQQKAYPLSSLPKHRLVEDKLGDTELRISYDPQQKKPNITAKDGKEIPYIVAFWFAWQAFYPNTELWSIEQ